MRCLGQGVEFDCIVPDHCLFIYYAIIIINKYEPSHEILFLVLLRKIILQTCMCSHPMGQVVITVPGIKSQHFNSLTCFYFVLNLPRFLQVNSLNNYHSLKLKECALSCPNTLT